MTLVRYYPLFDAHPENGGWLTIPLLVFMI